MNFRKAGILLSALQMAWNSRLSRAQERLELTNDGKLLVRLRRV